MDRFAAVERENGEGVRRALQLIRGVRKDRRIIEERDRILIPLADHISAETAEEMGFEIIRARGRPRIPYRTPMQRILSEIDLPHELLHHLPRKWELIGDVLVLRLPEELREWEEMIASIYGDVLGARTVCEETDRIRGVRRLPSVRVLRGGSTLTTHTENGILYKMDVAKVMFSSGNIDERTRMARLDCEGEVVVDMFAGIGYFTLPLAVHAGAERIIGCEINPIASRFLMENARLNQVEDRILVFQGDNRRLPLWRMADRVIMGYVGTTHLYLDKAISLLREGGIIHYHETCGVDEVEERPARRIEKAAGGRGCEILGTRVVKSYAPYVSHVVVDARIPG